MLIMKERSETAAVQEITPQNEEWGVVASGDAWSRPPRWQPGAAVREEVSAFDLGLSEEYTLWMTGFRNRISLEGEPRGSLGPSSQQTTVNLIGDSLVSGMTGIRFRQMKEDLLHVYASEYIEVADCAYVFGDAAHIERGKGWWAYVSPETEAIARLRTLQDLSAVTIESLRSFAELEEGWDSYGAKIIKPETIVRAMDLFFSVVEGHPNAPVPFVSPCPDGQINFEWETLSRTLMHLVPEEPDNAFRYITIDKLDGQESKRSGKAIGLEAITTFVRGWLEGDE